MRISDWSSVVCSSDLRLSQDSSGPVRSWAGRAGASAPRAHSADIAEYFLEQPAIAAKRWRRVPFRRNFGHILPAHLVYVPHIACSIETDAPNGLITGLRSEQPLVGTQRVMSVKSRWSPDN